MCFLWNHVLRLYVNSWTLLAFLISYGKMHKITSHILKALRTEWSSIRLTCSILHIYLSTWVQLHRYITNGHVSSCFMLCILCGVLVFSHLNLQLHSLTKCPFHLPENYYYHSRSWGIFSFYLLLILRPQYCY